MSLFSCVWSDDGPRSLLVDADDAKHAAKIATDVATGTPPARIVQWASGVFAAEVRFPPPLDDDDEEEDGEDEVVLEPLPHVCDLLDTIEGGEGGDGPITLAEEEEACGEVADYPGADGETIEVECVLPEGHDGPHQGTAPNGQPLEW